ncbi:hypothetical protein BDW74DRAFT_187005 [Aspergillus multicolor]|uniref:uncharacterized protein n=1 Tax=Aspergillus multicolor TaxID=41759 RepID=UPI003CCD75BD
MSSTTEKGRKEFSCTYCQRVFRKLEHLQRHTRRHTNEKPFACSCGALFSRQDLLRRHERLASQEGTEQSGQHHAVRQEAAFIPFQALTPSTNVSADQSIRPLNNILTPSVPVQLVQPAASIGHARYEDSTDWPLPNDFPTVFPSQLSLATQIVPHFPSPSVTQHDRTRLLSSLVRLSDKLLNPTLPSTSALTRYLAGYFTSFYPHVPFTHTPTFRLEACTPELCLAMMAVGAIDRFETRAAMQLFHYAKALLLDTQRHKAHMVPFANVSSVDEVQCLLCLAHFATWQNNPSLNSEATVLQSLLVQALRVDGLEERTETPQPLSWEQWAQQESERRTKLFAFCFLGLQNIAYNVPPSIWCDEVDLKLPCSCPEWTAADANTWDILRDNTPRQGEQRRFIEVLNELLSPDMELSHTTTANTPAGNYVLMHGLLQKILWTARSMPGNHAQTNSHQPIFESALRKWTSYWQQTPESNLEPLDPNGPLPYASTALLSLAYVRNCFKVPPSRKILTWSPPQIARALRVSPPVARNWGSLLAAYHATNFLATLVKLGVRYVKQNQSILWSIESTLCGLDCSVFLEKWLRSILDATQDAPLADHETRLVDWISEVVYEGLSSADDCSFHSIAGPPISPDQIITVWSHIMQGNSPYPFIKMISEVLVEYQRASTTE